MGALGAREYDPSDGRFLEVDPEGTNASDSDLSAYLYAEDAPTLLTDPSGLDPCFGGKTLNCKHNSLLCKFIYGTGYKDGCKGQCLRNALVTLAGRGIDFNYLYAAAIGEGKIVNASDGPSGPGIYFVHGKSYLIRPPSGPKCGLACALGKGTTIALGCNSTATCGVMGALIVLPGVEEARMAEEAEVAERAAVGGAEAVRIGQEGEAAVRAVEDIGPKVPIEIAGRTRIPDGLTEEVLTEVKNVKSLSFTQQLRDYESYANQTGRQFRLWTRSNTQLSGPLEDAVRNHEIVLRVIPGT